MAGACSSSGAPAAGDTFTVANNAGGTGDNRNCWHMAQALSRGVLSGGTESIDGAVSRFVGAIGVATNQASASADAQQVIYEDSAGRGGCVSAASTSTRRRPTCCATSRPTRPRRR